VTSISSIRVAELATHRDQENEDAQDAGGSRLEALGGFGIGGFDLPVEKKENPGHRKERFIEPEHSGPPKVLTQVREGKFQHATSVRGFVATLFASIVGSLNTFVHISS
jgi:hypothetical protein